MSAALSLETLARFVEGEVVAIRGKAVLEPAGGPGDKIFPPTHSVDDQNPAPGARYAFEVRRLHGGGTVQCVLLDSVQSQANRMEEALEALWQSREISLPVIRVDLTSAAKDAGAVTSLSAPHRIADALLRDSLHEGRYFRLSPLGKYFTEASPRHASPLFQVCPTALLFGLWDSTGPKKNLGAKFARAITSEIVGVGAQYGVKTSSRIDPASIVKDAATIYEASTPDDEGNPTWTPHLAEARPAKVDKPVDKPEDAKKWGNKDRAGKPSSILHGNVAPTIDVVAGGVTIDYAEQTVVLSLAALRKLHFGKESGKARTVLAALGLLALLAAQQRGHDLRSRCLLVPRLGHALKLEAVHLDGSCVPIDLSLGDALALFKTAVSELPDGLRFGKWQGDSPRAPLEAGEPMAELTPSGKLVYLIQESRKVAGSAEAGVGS